MAAARTPASRELQRRRIALVTRGLAVASVVATAIFGIAAAHTGKVSSGASSGDTGATESEDGGVLSSDDDFSSPGLTPSQSAPSQSFAPPVTSSGGS